MLPLLLLAAAPDGLAPDAEAHWVSFTAGAGNQIRFTALLNGNPVRAILDTGISNTLLSRAAAAKLGITAPRRSVQANAIGGTLAMGWARATSLQLGAFSRQGVRIGIADTSARFDADLFVGSDVTSCCALEIDYAGQRFRLLPSGRLPFTGTTVPLTRTSAGIPAVAARLNGRTLRPMILDTGDGAAVTLSRAAWLASGYAGARITTTLGWGLGGTVVTETAVVRGFGLADTTPPETEVRIEGAQPYAVRVGVAGRIGSGWLMRFHVLIDPGAARLVLAPGPDWAAPVARSTSGLLLGEADDALEVLHVMRGSPAEAGGWRAGERICAVNGVAVAEAAPDWLAAPGGTVVALRRCDGGERRMTLRAFY